MSYIHIVKYHLGAYNVNKIDNVTMFFKSSETDSKILALYYKTTKILYSNIVPYSTYVPEMCNCWFKKFTIKINYNIKHAETRKKTSM